MTNIEMRIPSKKALIVLASEFFLFSVLMGCDEQKRTTEIKSNKEQPSQKNNKDKSSQNNTEPTSSRTQSDSGPIDKNNPRYKCEFRNTVVEGEDLTDINQSERSVYADNFDIDSLGENVVVRRLKYPNTARISESVVVSGSDRTLLIIKRGGEIVGHHYYDTSTYAIRSLMLPSSERGVLHLVLAEDGDIQLELIGFTDEKAFGLSWHHRRDPNKADYFGAGLENSNGNCLVRFQNKQPSGERVFAFFDLQRNRFEYLKDRESKLKPVHEHGYKIKLSRPSTTAKDPNSEPRKNAMEQTTSGRLSSDDQDDRRRDQKAESRGTAPTIDDITRKDFCLDRSPELHIYGKNFGKIGGEVETADRDGNLVFTVDRWQEGEVSGELNPFSDPGHYKIQVCPADKRICSNSIEITARNGCR